MDARVSGADIFGIKMIQQLLSNIKAEILELPAIESCFIYPTPRCDLAAPTVCLEVAGFSPSNDPATGELALNINLEARVIVDSTFENAETSCQTLACNIANLIHLNTFNCAVSSGEVTGISRDSFKPEFDAFVCWLVEWSHQFHIGNSVWLESGATPHLLHINRDLIDV